MPQTVNFNVSSGVPFTTSSIGAKSFNENVPIFEERNYTITGVSRDATGIALGSCVVKLFNTTTDVLIQAQTSDASGNFSFTIDKNLICYLVCYKDGTPVFGTSKNTLVAI